ncbi:M23 family metallopeptidase [Cytophagales bacterium LB-30]|uniref:M23 family metallopeptidase n=1 Tax=Shiella aurantiaca TaxID=3058365 RepID=A0ABT8F3R3_9BACT|nr:M23 family metallopeptidase [Shiella aurantiaca]MDN4165103.1 M23 family metallopeptidase [Shiella aurantiaca]
MLLKIKSLKEGFWLYSLHSLWAVLVLLSCTDDCETGSDRVIEEFPHVYQWKHVTNEAMEKRAPTTYPSQYDWFFPIPHALFESEVYQPSSTNTIWVSPYGPRYLAGNTASFGQDLHGGFDSNKRLSDGTENFDCDEGNPAPILCFCNGTIMEFREYQNDVFIKCDEKLRYADGTEEEFFVVYRHMSEVLPAIHEVDQDDASTYIPITKGDYIGLMGSKGANNCHLHFDLRTAAGDYLHPGRLFNPSASAYYKSLKEASEDAVDIRLLGYDESTKQAFVRIAMRGNILSLSEIRVANGVIPFNLRFNFEERQQLELPFRDNPQGVDGLTVLAYPFNGYSLLIERVNSVLDGLPELYPVSTKREDSQYPLLADDSPLYNEPSLMYDIIIDNIDGVHLLTDLKISLCDFYGNCLETDMPF